MSSPNTYGDQINDILEPIKTLNLEDIKSKVTGGRLVAFHSNWCQITNDKWILNTIQGYGIEWIQKPDQSHWYGNPQMSQTQTEMIDLEVKTVLEKGAVEPFQNTPDQFISHLFLRPKRDGTMRPVFNLKKMNRNANYEHFKMEGMPAVSRPVKTKRLVDKNRSQRCLLCGEHFACRPQVLEIPMERENLGLQSSTIRAGFGSTSVHKNSETSNGTDDESRIEESNLAKRHVAHASTTPNVSDTNKNNSFATSEAGISNKQTEICSGANEKSGIHRLRNQHSTDETVLTNRESWENKGRMPSVTVSEVNKCQEIGQNNCQNDSRSESNLTSTTAVSTPSETENSRSTTKASKLRNSSDTECGMLRGTEIVGGSHRFVEWQKLLESKSGFRSGNPDRCQQNRLGSTLQRD